MTHHINNELELGQMRSSQETLVPQETSASRATTGPQRLQEPGYELKRPWPKILTYLVALYILFKASFLLGSIIYACAKGLTDSDSLPYLVYFGIGTPFYLVLLIFIVRGWKKFPIGVLVSTWCNAFLFLFVGLFLNLMYSANHDVMIIEKISLGLYGIEASSSISLFCFYFSERR